MPATAPARSFRWSDLPSDVPMDRLSRRRIIGDQVMVSEVILEAGCDVPVHQHENEQMAMVVSGRLRFEVQQPGTTTPETVEVGAGEVLHLPSNVPHGVVALERSVVLDIFSPISETTGIDLDD